ncbi:unnamed protein product, partial [Phaeothamnion confervicola]
QKYDISHPTYWKGPRGEHPQPFTLISSKDIADSTWTPVDPANLAHCEWYTAELEKSGRFVHCIWPEHCLIGTPGHNVQAHINEALQAWAGANMKTVRYIQKGEN